MRLATLVTGVLTCVSAHTLLINIELAGDGRALGGLTSLHPVDVSEESVDLAVVAEHPHGLRERPPANNGRRVRGVRNG